MYHTYSAVKDQMLAVLKHMEDPEDPILSLEALRRLGEKRRRAKSNERRAAVARVRRETQVKQEKDNDDEEDGGNRKARVAKFGEGRDV